MDTVRILSDAAGDIFRQQGASAAVLFWAKVIRDPVATADWIDFIGKHHSAFQAAAPNPRALRKPQRNYGVVGRTVRQRAEALMDHYEFAAGHLAPSAHRALLNLEQVPLARLSARGTSFDLWLGSSMPFGQKQEGELTVWLANASGTSLARMAFTFDTNADGQRVLLIGGLQGLQAVADKKIIVTATRALSGLRPKDAVLVGVQAIARALGIKHVMAVANKTHVLAAEWMMSDSVISRDYDGFWLERGGTVDRDVGFRLPCPDYAGRVAATTTPRLIDTYRAALTNQVLANLPVKT